MDEWKKWFNADYAFFNNGEKIKAVVKKLFTVNLVLLFIVAVFGFIGFLAETFNGNFEYVWFIPFAIIIVLFLAPYLVYWSLCFVYGYGELVANSYSNGSGRKKGAHNKANVQNEVREIYQPQKTYLETENMIQEIYVCPKCDSTIHYKDEKCKKCGAIFDWDEI